MACVEEGALSGEEPASGACEARTFPETSSFEGQATHSRHRQIKQSDRYLNQTFLVPELETESMSWRRLAFGFGWRARDPSDFHRSLRPTQEAMAGTSVLAATKAAV